MPGAGRAEVYFIAAMMILIIVLCVAAVFFFFRTYKREMKDKLAAAEVKKEKKSVSEAGK